jgi:hypothetical protein
MAAKSELVIPILTDAIDPDDQGTSGEPEAVTTDRETLIAELQTQLAASAFALTEDIMRTAFAEMEASIFEQITGRLRRELPEMIDILLRERLGNDEEF